MILPFRCVTACIYLRACSGRRVMGRIPHHVRHAIRKVSHEIPSQHFVLFPDKLPDRVATCFMRLSDVKFGNLNCSRLTDFEAPDPVYWVQQGYAVLRADVRGMYKSEGQAGGSESRTRRTTTTRSSGRHPSRGVRGESALCVFRIWPYRNGAWQPSSHLTCVR